MSLNDEVLGDIESESVVDNSVIHAPSLLPRSGVNITLIPETEVIQAKDTLDVDEMKTLPEMDIKFKLVEDGKTTVTSLQEVESQIIAQEGINIAGARYVNEAFGGTLFDGNVKESFYTPAVTRTNFDHVKNHMSRKIAMESQALVANFQALLDEPLEDAKNRLTKVRDVYMPAARDTSLKATACILDIKDSVKSKKNVIFPIKGDTVTFKNILTVDLKTLDTETIDSPELAYKLSSIVATIKKCLEDSNFSRFMYGILQQDSLQNKLDKSRPDCTINPLTFEDIVKIYDNDGIYDSVKELFDHADTCIKRLEEIQTSADGYKETVEKVTEYLAKEGSKIRECFDSIEFFYSFISSVNQFNTAVCELTDFINTL